MGSLQRPEKEGMALVGPLHHSRRDLPPYPAGFPCIGQPMHRQ